MHTVSLSHSASGSPAASQSISEHCFGHIRQHNGPGGLLRVQYVARDATTSTLPPCSAVSATCLCVWFAGRPLTEQLKLRGMGDLLEERVKIAKQAFRGYDISPEQTHGYKTKLIPISKQQQQQQTPKAASASHAPAKAYALLHEQCKQLHEQGRVEEAARLMIHGESQPKEAPAAAPPLGGGSSYTRLNTGIQ